MSICIHLHSRSRTLTPRGPENAPMLPGWQSETVLDFLAMDDVSNCQLHFLAAERVGDICNGNDLRGNMPWSRVLPDCMLDAFYEFIIQWTSLPKLKRKGSHRTSF